MAAKSLLPQRRDCSCNKYLNQLIDSDVVKLSETHRYQFVCF